MDRVAMIVKVGRGSWLITFRGCNNDGHIGSGDVDVADGSRDDSEGCEKMCISSF